MHHLSIKTKLIAFISTTLALLVITLVAISWVQLNNNNQTQSSRVQSVLLDEINDKLMSKTQYYATEIAGYINTEYKIPLTLSGGLANTAKTTPLSREGVYQMTLGALAQNPDISSIYAQFEANGYDQKDSEFGNGFTHSVPGVGTLEIYITRENDGRLVQHQVEDAAEKYLSDKNEFGFRESEWYLCAKDTQKPCIMEPYLYEIEPGQSELMTSLTVPIISNNKFIGIVGTDINLPKFQSLTESISNSLYNGQAKVTILSNIGLVVGSSHYKKIARPLSESLTNGDANSIMNIRKRQENIEVGNNLVFAMPIKINVANTTWSLIIELPKSVALASAVELAESQASATASVGKTMVMIGVLVSVIAIAVSIVILRTIVKPITDIKQRIENLASSEGDLTVSLTVTQHEELILLASGFNQFTQKLRTMIDGLKALANDSFNQSANTSQAAQEIKAKVNMQHMEIDSVVTAINELSATASEVARSSENAATTTNNTNLKVKESERGIVAASHSVETMTSHVNSAKDSISAVAQRSNDITHILDVIRSIAEQTNLLALNAAIEAARAGEQGRGFAVVADEVRSLASKTQDSTNEISQLIDNLQSEVGTSETIIEKSVAQASDAMAHCAKAASQMGEMVNELALISNEVTQIATAAEEQSAVTEDLSANMTGISDAAAELSELADTVEQAAAQLTYLVEQKHKQLSQLKTE
ncbi:methyl-accepting chemotaxis protein [Pseudoalteromonas sp. G4]|uniref:methyl-accepting chemotaxis protein n=1 Tax=Pseudoalteromonas sp. G4 TaxID=2992761 RepID=UPI00237DD404|nr:methyl-accepting chemotaxis protein [Pseudoalteromonas sp. G4]MDE3270435.1 methyl-accepting chemotaxis protein [Pseudoalteromonas sp. G4]